MAVHAHARLELFLFKLEADSELLHKTVLIERRCHYPRHSWINMQKKSQLSSSNSVQYALQPPQILAT